MGKKRSDQWVRYYVNFMNYAWKALQKHDNEEIRNWYSKVLTNAEDALCQSAFARALLKHQSYTEKNEHWPSLTADDIQRLNDYLLRSQWYNL